MEPGEKMYEGIKLFAEGFIESINKLVDEVSRDLRKFIKYFPIDESLTLLRAKNSNDSRKRKAYVIYHRTKSKRIKNKQLKIMEG